MKEHVAEIVAAYVRKNRIDPSVLPEVIATVSRTLADLGKPEAPPPASRVPAVSVRRSATDEAVICVDCGWKGKMLATPSDERTRRDPRCVPPEMGPVGRSPDGREKLRGAALRACKVDRLGSQAQRCNTRGG